MADNITTSATFATANMKPAAAGGENIDAVWGRNVADNTGFLFYRKLPGPCFGFAVASGAAGTLRGTHFFEKSAGMATFFGSFVGSASTGNPQMFVYMNGTQIFSDNSNGTLYSLTIGTDLVGIADGAMVAVGWAVKFPGAVGECNFAFTGWQKP